MLRRGGRGGDDDDGPGRGGRGGPGGPGGGGPGGGGPDRYKMRENLISIGDDFWIETEHGRRAFFVNGKALRVRDTLEFQDMQGRTLCQIQGRMMRVRDTMVIERPQGNITVKKALITPLRDRYVADMPGSGEIEIQGNIVSHEYRMERNGRQVAEVSKKWIRLADTYTVEVAAGEDDIVILAIAVAIDQMSHDVA